MNTILTYMVQKMKTEDVSGVGEGGGGATPQKYLGGHAPRPP